MAANPQVKYTPLTNDGQSDKIAIQYGPNPADSVQPQYPGGTVAAPPPSFTTPYQPHVQDMKNDVTVVTQQPIGTQSVAQRPRKIQKLTTPTLIMIVFFVMTGQIATLLCLIPALIFSLMSNKHASTGNYRLAKRLERITVALLTAVFVFYMIPVALAGIAVAVYFGITRIPCLINEKACSTDTTIIVPNHRSGWQNWNHLTTK